MAYIITQIAQAKKNTERVNIYLNGKFWLGLGKNDLVSLKLATGKEISDLEKYDIEKTAFNGKVINRALNYMQIRPRSCGEVRDYLVVKKAIPEEDAENAISYLQDKNLLSDESFALWYAEYKFSTGVNGINKIKVELMKKRLNAQVINEVLAKLVANEDFKNDQALKIEEYARKIVGTIKAKDTYELKAKLTKRLMARGFKYDEVKKIVKEL